MYHGNWIGKRKRDGIFVDIAIYIYIYNLKLLLKVVGKISGR